MQDLEPRHHHTLMAALGWLELGNPKEAQAELEALSDTLRSHPATLEVRWRVFAAAKVWEPAIEIAAELARIDPTNPAGAINQAFGLHELQRTEEAWNCLLTASKSFPIEPTIAYNLGCYACQLGRPNLALEWLNKAARLIGPRRLKRMAATDPDLAPLREQIQQL